MHQRTFSHFGYLVAFSGILALSALPGCAADDVEEAPPADPSSEDEIKQSPAVKAFLKDPAVKAEIGGRKYAPPQTALVQGGSFGRPVSTYIVVTYVDVTRPDIMDAHVTKTVLGQVFVGPTGNTTVSLADLKDLDAPRESSAFAIACALNPNRSESDIARRIRSASALAQPNRLIVSHADRLLGRDGRMLRALDELGPGNLTIDLNGWLYVTEIYTRHDLITPLSGFGVTVPSTLYSIAYF